MRPAGPPPADCLYLCRYATPGPSLGNYRGPLTRRIHPNLRVARDDKILDHLLILSSGKPVDGTRDRENSPHANEISKIQIQKNRREIKSKKPRRLLASTTGLPQSLRLIFVGVAVPH